MKNEAFWTTWADIGRELLDYGEQIQFGNSLVEVKFMHGTPAVIIRSKSIKKKYPDNDKAKTAIMDVLEDSERVAFDGARTMTVAYHNGDITAVILDEYGNSVIR